jgi:hypothetical protein
VDFIDFDRAGDRVALAVTAGEKRDRGESKGE